MAQENVQTKSVSPECEVGDYVALTVDTITYEVIRYRHGCNHVRSRMFTFIPGTSGLYSGHIKSKVGQKGTFALLSLDFGDFGVKDFIVHVATLRKIF